MWDIQHEIMKPRITTITLGVADLRRAIQFYRDGLGFPTDAKDDAPIAFFMTQGVRLALYPKEALAEDISAGLQLSRRGFGGITLGLILFFQVTCLPGLPPLAEDSPRISATVQLIQRIKPAVVPIFAFSSKGELSSGAGAVIHPSGFVLTADHVTRDVEGVALFGLTREPYRIVGRLPEKDLALLKVATSDPGPLPAAGSDREKRQIHGLALRPVPPGRHQRVAPDTRFLIPQTGAGGFRFQIKSRRFCPWD